MKESSNSEKKSDWLGLSERQLEIILLYVISFAVYGIWASQDVVTMDAEGLYSGQNAQKWYLQWYEMGRWFLVLLKKFLNALVINPYLSVALLLIFFPLSAILWDALLRRWAGEEKIPNWFLLVFGAAYLLHPIFAFQFAYRNQMDVISIMMAMLPVTMLLLTDALERRRIPEFIVSLVLMTMLFGGYQSFLFMAADGAAIYLYFLARRKYGTEKKHFWRMFLKLLLCFILCFALSSLIAKYYRVSSGVSSSAYLAEQFQWGKLSAAECLENIRDYLETFMFHNVLSDSETTVLNSCLWSFYGIEMLIAAAHCVADFVRKRAERFVNVLLFAGIILIPFLLEIVTAGQNVIRSLFAYVLTFAFLLVLEIHWFLAALQKVSGKVVRAVVLAALIFIVTILGTNTTRLLYTDNLTMQQDREMLSQIYYQAMAKGAQEGYAIYFVGARNMPLGSNEMYLQDENIGISYLEVFGAAGPDKTVEAMQAYGYSVTAPTEEQCEIGEEVGKEMDHFPQQDSIRVLPEYQLIVVKIG